MKKITIMLIALLSLIYMVPAMGAGKCYFSTHKKKNPINDTSVSFLFIKSSNQIDFGFPYGRQNGSIVIRKNNKKIEIYFSVEAIIETTHNGYSKVYLRFDGGKAKKYYMSRSSDYKAVFVRRPLTLLKKIRKVKKLSFVFEPYQKSMVVFHFNLHCPFPNFLNK